jgi:hypothetical protein
MTVSHLRPSTMYNSLTIISHYYGKTLFTLSLSHLNHYYQDKKLLRMGLANIKYSFEFMYQIYSLNGSNMESNFMTS